MSEAERERAGVNLTALDFDGIEDDAPPAPKGKSARARERETTARVAEETGFTSRTAEPSKDAPRRRRRRRPARNAQVNIRCYGGVVEVFRELGYTLAVKDCETFERALVALCEKEGETELLEELRTAMEGE